MDNGHDSYRPAEIAALIETAGVAKARLPTGQMLVLAILAGAFIGFGAIAYLAVMTGVDPAYGPARLLGGLVFCLGLILVIVGGAELFTGNALMVMAAVDGKITPGALLRQWAVVYAGNVIGAVGLALAFALAALPDSMAETAVRVAVAKTVAGPTVLFVKGALCNALVCLAVWLTFSARDTTGKILAIIWPISAFVLLGMEHSVANMFLLPFGILCGAEIGAQQVLANLFWVTIGNVAGGAGGVALAYRYAFLGGKKD